jgi:hypothetical protein
VTRADGGTLTDAYYDRQRQMRATLAGEQRGVVLEQPFTAEDAAATFAELGLRVQNATLAQNSANVEL